MEKISKVEAQKLGLKRFFTGDACVNGHLSARYVANGQCIDCRARNYDPVKMQAYNKAYRLERQDEIRQYDNERHRQKADAKRAKKIKYLEDNRLQIQAENLARDAVRRRKARERVKEWRKQNPGKKQAQHAKRRSIKHSALPNWFDELDVFVWEAAADLAILRREATGIDWHLDHMIPLSAKKACGLHAWNNCQVIPQKLNNWKHSKFILTEPLEWLKYI